MTINGKNISRRNFIRNTGIIAASTAIIPSIFSSCNTKKKSINGKVNVASIGVGGRGSNHVVGVLKLAAIAQLVAVCDPYEDRRTVKAQKVNEFYAKQKGLTSYKGCKAYNHFQDVLDREDVDAVVISTPDHWHVPIAIAAAKAGKHVYLEKPVGLSIPQGQKLREAINDSGVVFQYGTQQRSGKNFRHACELTRNEVIGKLERIEAWCDSGKNNFAPIPTEAEAIPAGFDYDLWQGPALKRPYSKVRASNKGAWFIDDYAIGFVAGWGAHPLDIAQWGNNTDETSPIEYSGTGSFFAEDNIFNTMNSWDIHAKYANGVDMHFCSYDVAKPIVSKYRPFMGHGTTFFGSKGWVSVDRKGVHVSNPEWLNHQFTEGDIRLVKSSDHMRNFIEAIKNGTPTVSPIESAIRSDTISHLCDILVRSGEGSLKWNPEAERIVNPTSKITSLFTKESRSPYGDILNG